LTDGKQWRIHGCNSDKKLIFGKKKVATPVFTEPIQFIINASDVLGSTKKNKRSMKKRGRIGEGEILKVCV
jgi:hypothetical protein